MCSEEIEKGLWQRLLKNNYRSVKNILIAKSKAVPKETAKLCMVMIHVCLDREGGDVDDYSEIRMEPGFGISDVC